MPLNNSSPASSAKNDPAAGRKPVTFQGIGVSAGIVIGHALLLGRAYPEVSEVAVEPAGIDLEKKRFRSALAASRRQLAELKERVLEALGEKDAGIFDAHLMLLDDRTITEEVERGITALGRNAEWVFHQAMERHLSALQGVTDPYIRDRIADIRDVAGRVLRNLRGEETPDITRLPEHRILIAHDLSPSDTAGMDKANVIGFVTTIGSQTSHTAIMARSMGIPAVVGAQGALDQVNSGDLVILDGFRGLLIAHPEPDQLEEYQRRLKAQEVWFHNLEAEASLPAETLDGFRVQLAANIELAEEVDGIKRSYGVGVGLFRTEYLFLNRPTLPDEECQFEAYRRAAEEIFPQSVIIRTLDIGGDKFLSHLNLPQELNPFLGVRAIRFCLTRPDIFLSQLRAILRASAHGKVRLMFPMIATMEELDQALVLLDRARRDLDARGQQYNRHLDIGIMIEVPAAVMLADRLAAKVDFFSIGTNDLIQYSLAADRSNPGINYLYQPCHPAIIRFLQQTSQAATQHGIWVSVCGEMASDPILAPLILGLGIQELSMNPRAIAQVKRLIRHMRMIEAEDLVRQALTHNTAAEIRGLCEAFVRRVAPDLLAG
ncbi:MAG: phosphoenolpyruvate--protein phosphotransferase [Lentisphaeria bacterium]